MPEDVRIAKLIFDPSGYSVWAAGDELEYIVSLDPPMCTCPDFSFRLARGRPSPCKHIRAVLRAAYWGEYSVIHEGDGDLMAMLTGIPQRSPRR
ncbi:MAG: SWIM zinc finger family protein [Nitrososphaeria archaeon]